MNDKIIPVDYGKEMEENFRSYAMTVITNRAIPDARDGLKPVQRRVLYSMGSLGLSPAEPHRKSARIVGETMGKYHPHGDRAIYEAMVRMAQDFSLRVPLVDGQGNFGSIDGDGAAAMRYTEARLSPTGEKMLESLGENAVDMEPNFDESLLEPSVLPVAFPNMLVNGASGIAVGLATNIPCHNPVELSDAVKLLLKRKKVSVEDLLQVMPGPDFPTGGTLVGRDGIVDYYSSGKGRLVLRGRVLMEKTRKGSAIVITEIPYALNKEALVESIYSLAEKEIGQGIAAVRDESDRKGMRLVVEVAPKVSPEALLELLFAKTPLQGTFNVNMVSLIGGKPVTTGIIPLLEEFIQFRKEVIRRRTAWRLDKAERKLHILEGLLEAIDMIDAVIRTVRESPSPSEALKGLVGIGFTPEQAQAILDMRLARLTRLQKEELEKERNRTQKAIDGYRKILGDEKVLEKVLVTEMDEAVPKTERRTDIIEEGRKTSVAGAVEELVPEQPGYVYITEDGLISKRIFKRKVEPDSNGFSFVLPVTSVGSVDLLTESGTLYSLKVQDIPEQGARSAGCPISEKVDLDGPVILAWGSEEEKGFLVAVSRKGLVKRMKLSCGGCRQRKGKKIVPFDEGIFKAFVTDGKQLLLMVTAKGKGVLVKEEEFRPQGNTGRGHEAIRLKEGDSFADAILYDGGALLSTTGDREVPVDPSLSPMRRRSVGVYLLRLKKNETVKGLRTEGSEASEAGEV